MSKEPRTREFGAPSRRHGRRVQAMVLGVLTMLCASMALIGMTSTASAQPTCSPPNPPRHPPGNPMLVTEGCVDPRYNDPYILVDEVRSVPVPHRFVHGGWSGTPARFAFYFPGAEQYQGRFYQGPTHQLRFTGEIASDAEIQHAFASGAYLVLTNPLQDYALTSRDAVAGWGHPDSSGYRVDAAAAKVSRGVAAQVYGYAHRPYGYVYGGSGGAFQTIAKAEWTIGVWDGFVSFVMGHPLASPDHFTVRLHAKRVLDSRNKFPEILDAIDPGGSGDPYATLNGEEAAALREAHRLGFPPRAWYQHASISGGLLFLVAGYVPLLDPTYVDDFWTQPGYLGHDDPYGSITAARIQHPTAVTAASAPIPPPDYNSLGPLYNTYLLSQYATGPPRTVTLASLPASDLTGTSLVMVTGAAAGKFVSIGTVDRNTNTITFGGGEDPNVVNMIAVGDQVRVDNSFYLALQTHPRHQVTDQFGELSGWNQFRNPGGTPIYPQRPDTSPGEYNSFNAAGAISTGRIRPGNKVIVVENLMDIDAFAWSADWYRTKVLENLDPGESLDDHFRLWFTDHAEHGFVDFINPPGAGRANTRTVGYTGVLQQALRDLEAWAERGVPPPDNTSYQVVDSQIVVPVTAAERGGIQPVVHLKANGRVRANVPVGATVTFTATIETPPGTGDVVAAEWDLDDEDGSDYPAADQPAAPVTPAPTVNVAHTHSYTATGTYFVALRGTSQREGDPATPYWRIQNLDRARVVVCDYAQDPDLDGDGDPDACDNCPFVANPGQEDTGGVDTAEPDGIGNACQCGDVTGNGIVNGQDANTIKRHGLGLEPNPTFVVPGNCDVSGSNSCNGQDANAVKREALGLDPNPLFGQACHNATGDPLPPGL